MPFDTVTQPSTVDLRSRAQLTERMDGPCTRDELRACLRDLARLNRWFSSYRPILNWLDALPTQDLPQPLRILDVGCGYGDTLRRVERWATKRDIAVELIGIDLNPDATAIAAEATPPSSRIHWVASDIFAFTAAEPVHLVVSSLFTHHLVESDIVRFLEWMERNAGIGWFINDLSRAAVPYYFLRIFTRLAGLHPFVQSDGPVSVERAFVPEDWRRMCAAAGFKDSDYEIRPFKPGRLCIARRIPT